MPYLHLTPLQRIELNALERAGQRQVDIARLLGCSQPSISRELRRGRSTRGTYDARLGQRHRDAGRLRANARFQTLRADPALQATVIRGLEATDAPEQIAGRLHLETGAWRVRTSTIYRWIHSLRPDLRIHLRCEKGRWRRRRGTGARVAARRSLGAGRSIDARPVSVAERAVVGDWEGDTVRGTTGGSAAIATMVERTSGYLEAAKVSHATAEETRRALGRRLRRHPEAKRRTTTVDNGPEFGEGDLLERELGMPVYFAHPYHSWERGTNENTNGLLRQFFPKKTSLTHVTQAEIDKKVAILNNRPRKRLGYRTPSEVFNGYALRRRM